MATEAGAGPLASRAGGAGAGVEPSRFRPKSGRGLGRAQGAAVPRAHRRGIPRRSERRAPRARGA
eukprot:3897558-Pyramimonas_sp.AAC.1